jgi:hypothetical protein
MNGLLVSVDLPIGRVDGGRRMELRAIPWAARVPRPGALGLGRRGAAEGRGLCKPARHRMLGGFPDSFSHGRGRSFRKLSPKTT